MHETEREKANHNTLLKSHNCYVQHILYPTVPKKSARLRINMTLKYSLEDVDNLVLSLKNVWEENVKSKNSQMHNKYAI